MFLRALENRNRNLIKAGFELHQSGEVLPDSYIIDVDMFLVNAGKILEEARKYGIKLYYMLKQLGRNPYLARKLQDMGYEGAVAVDFKEAGIMMENGIRIGNIGHLVQIPDNMTGDVLRYRPEIVTVYSLEKARNISQICEKNGNVQDIMLRINGRDSRIYPGQEAGFEIEGIRTAIKKLVRLKGIRIAGLTSFPCFLYDEGKGSIEPTENIRSVLEVRELLKKEFDIDVSQINFPSATSVGNIGEIHRLGGTHGEPGHAFTGTLPTARNSEIEEIPAYIYVSEVSHNFRGKGYFFGGGYYSRGGLENALIGKGINEYRKAGVSTLDSSNIDYYLGLSEEGRVGETVITCFRTQMFVTRSTVVLVEGIQEGKPEIIGKYLSTGQKIK